MNARKPAREVRVGVIGCGAMGTSLARHCSALHSAQVVATADVEIQRAKELAEELDAEYSGSHRGLLDREGLEAVVVAVPNFLHEKIAVDAANAGKHIFCEKPMALSVRECDRMIRAAKANHVKLMIGQVLRYAPMFEQVKRIIDSNVIGRPFSVYLERIDTIDWCSHGSAWRGRAEFSGGMLFHCNVHELDYMMHICGAVDSVAAFTAKNVAKDIDYEDVAHVLLRFKTGAIGTLLGGHCSSLPGRGGKIHCTKGSLDFAEGRIRYKPFDGELVTTMVEEGGGESPVRRELREFIRCIVEDTAPPIPGEEGRRAIEVIEAAYRSARGRREVKVRRDRG